MRLLTESQKIIVFVSFFSIAVLILIGVPIHNSVAKKVETNFDSADFDSDSDDINNMYMPLVPGTEFDYEADTEDGIERDEVVVTNNPCNILGVDCIEVTDNAYLDGCLIEHTFDWFAQDIFGNVWYLGEDTESYTVDDDCNILEMSTEGSWEAGVDGAEAGIVMLANPKMVFHTCRNIMRAKLRIWRRFSDSTLLSRLKLLIMITA